MTAAFALSPSDVAGLRRLTALAELDDGEMQSLQKASESRRRVAANREILTAGQPIAEPSILLSGWAARIWSFADGRRQILNLVLPGELIGMSHQRPLAASGIFAMTEVTLCPAPPPQACREGKGLAQAYGISQALEQSYLYRHIARLGRLSAHERMIDWLLEIHDRLDAAGLVCSGEFPLPLTQEAAADALGLTSVHVNRTLQGMRKDGLVEIGRGKAKLLQPERLRASVGRHDDKW